jgi:hypothetical protein
MKYLLPIALLFSASCMSPAPCQLPHVEEAGSALDLIDVPDLIDTMMTLPRQSEETLAAVESDLVRLSTRTAMEWELEGGSFKLHRSEAGEDAWMAVIWQRHTPFMLHGDWDNGETLVWGCSIRFSDEGTVWPPLLLQAFTNRGGEPAWKHSFGDKVTL